MRRGLMAWDPNEAPATAFDDRLARLRADMRRDGIDAFVAYTNIARGGAVWWLTGFTPYWNEGLLYVPMQGGLVFTTALSKRVAEWIGSVMPVGQVTTTPRPSVLVGEHIARDGARRIGILELDGFPAGHAQAILQTAPGAELVDATACFARARDTTDAVERLLLARADALAADACAAVDVNVAQARDFIAPAELAARLGGAEECFALVAPDLARSAAFLRTESLGALGDTYAARVSLAYKGAWTRRTRSFARDASVQASFDRADAALATFAPPSGEALGDVITRNFAPIGRVASWVVEKPRGSYPLAAIADLANAPQSPVPAMPFCLTVEVAVDARRWIGTRMIGA